MTDGPVILGGVVFQDHEIPPKINIGGKQRLKVHEVIGDYRVVDAMGPEPDDKEWTGRFRGADAIARAQAVDAMRISGAEVSLTWLGLYYTVVVREFRADTEKRFEVPYTVKCCVVNDPGQSGGGSVGSLDSLVGADLSSLGSIVAAAPSGVSTALSALTGAVAAAPALANASIADLAPIVSASTSLSSAIDDAISGSALVLDSVSPDGLDPTAMISWLTNAADTASATSAAADMNGFAGRLLLNLSLASQA